MVIGMLWQDLNKDRTLVQKIQIAVEYYRQKYGRTPEICMVNKSMFEDGREPAKVEKALVLEGIIVTIRTADAWPPKDHLWLGVDQTPTKEAQEVLGVPV